MISRTISRLALAAIMFAALFGTLRAQSIDLCEQWRDFSMISETKALALDHQYLWVGTTGGLVRFDTLTYETKLYSKTNSGLPMNDVRALQMDRNGALWIGTFGGGVARLQNGNWTTFDQSNSGLKSNYILSLTVDSSNALWVGSYSGIAKMSSGNLVYVQLPNPPSYNKIDAMATDPAGNIWLAARAGNNYEEIDRFDGTKWTWYDDTNSLILPEYVFSFGPAKNGLIWMGSDYGNIESFDGSEWEAYVSQPGVTGGESPVYALAVDDTGAVWTGSWTGCARFYHGKWKIYGDGPTYAVVVHGGTTWFANNPGILRVRGNSIDRFLANSSLPSNNMSASLVVDKQGRTWATTAQSSLLPVFDGKNWTTITQQSIADGKSAPPSMYDGYALAADSLGNVWFGLSGIGVVRYDGTTSYVFNDTNSGLKSTKVTALAYDNAHHKLWAGTDKCLSVFDGTSWTSFPGYPTGFAFWNGFNGLTVDAAGVVWGTAAYGGLLRFDGTNYKLFGTADGLPDTYTTGVACDTSGAVWVATNSGLAKYQNGAFTVFTTSNTPLPTNEINSVAIDTRDRVWMGTFRVGAAMYDHGKWTIYDQNNSGITNNQINWVTADRYGNVWIGMEGDGLAEYSATGFANVTPLFASDTVFQCGSLALDTLPLSGGGCSGRKIIAQRITGADSNYYIITHAATTGSLTADSIVLSFAPDAARKFNATLEVTLEDGSVYHIPLQGFGPDATPVAFSTAGGLTDIIGGTVLVPIVLHGSAAVSQAELSIGYDTSMLVYAGTFSVSGNDLDAWKSTGRAHIAISSTDISTANDTVAYAKFLVYPLSQPCADVTFDSLQVSGNTKNCVALSSAPTVAHVCSSVSCGTDILSRILRYGQAPALSVTPNPAGASTMLKSDRTLGASQIDIIDALGATRLHLDPPIAAGTPIPISLRGLHEGFYYLKITSGTFTRVLPISHYDQ